MTVALVLLAGLVLDGGAALTAHGTAADTAQQAARAGADALDDTSLRTTTPARLTTNPGAARAAAQAVLAAADVTGDVTVIGTTVTVTAHAGAGVGADVCPCAVGGVGSVPGRSCRAAVGDVDEGVAGTVERVWSGGTAEHIECYGGSRCRWPVGSIRSDHAVGWGS